MDDEEYRRLFKVKKTELEMMELRGFDITRANVLTKKDFTQIDLSPYSNPNASLDDFKAQYGDIFLTRRNFSTVYYRAGSEDQNSAVYVIYLNNSPGSKTTKKEFTPVFNAITDNFRHIIIVTRKGLTAETTNFINTKVITYKIELFLDNELAFNRTKHALAPIGLKHIKAADSKQWGEEQQIQVPKIPIMMGTDPIAKFYGAEPLDVFEEVILGTTTDTAGYARLVRQAPTTKK